MMPIFLWSTVVTHARQPVFARGRAKTPRAEWSRPAPPEGSASTSEGRSTIAMASLLQRLEVGDERIDLVFGQVQVGHAAAALAGPSASRPGGFRSQALRSATLSCLPSSSRSISPLPSWSTQRSKMPPAKMPRLTKWVRFGRRARHLARCRREMSSLPPSPRDEVAAGAGRCGTSPCPALASALGGHLGALAAGWPRQVVVVGRRTGPRPACACRRGTGRRTRCTGRGRRPGSSASMLQRVVAAGDGVLLAVEGRDPEGVDDVARRDRRG